MKRLENRRLEERTALEIMQDMRVQFDHVCRIAERLLEERKVKSAPLSR